MQSLAMAHLKIDNPFSKQDDDKLQLVYAKVRQVQQNSIFNLTHCLPGQRQIPKASTVQG
jgi:hypothetical protein